MILFWHKTGPRLSWERECFKIDDLNPEAHIEWRMSRSELFKLGWQCMLAAMLGKRGAPL